MALIILLATRHKGPNSKNNLGDSLIPNHFISSKSEMHSSRKSPPWISILSLDFLART